MGIKEDIRDCHDYTFGDLTLETFSSWMKDLVDASNITELSFWLNGTWYKSNEDGTFVECNGEWYPCTILWDEIKKDI